MGILFVLLWLVGTITVVVLIEHGVVRAAESDEGFDKGIWDDPETVGPII